jgi:Glycosyltransferase family 28 C-terminal domain
MSCIIFATDYGNGLGDLATFLPIANELRKRDWHITFAIPHTSDALELITQIIGSAGYDYFEVVGATVKDAMTLVGRIGGCPSFANVETLRHDLDFWFTQLDRLKPALLIAGRAVFAIVAATLANIRCHALGMGIFHDQPSSDAQDSEVRSREQIATKRLLQMANAALHPDGRPPLCTFADLYRVERVLRVSTAGLFDDATASMPGYLGILPIGVHGPRIDWPLEDLTRPRLFACLRTRLANTATILEALADNGSLNVIASVPGIGADMRRRHSRDHLTIVDTPVDVRALLSGADAVICHASAGTLTQALSMGKPLLLAPATQEQLVYAQAAMRHKVALAVSPDSSSELICARIENLLAAFFAPGRSYTACARAIARKCDRADVAGIAASIDTAARLSQPLAAAPAVSSAVTQPSGVSFSDYDVIFLSYDEPDADARWDELKRTVPHAHRIHGVLGFDAAHKAAATASRSERFILVDGDNLVDERFFAIRTRVPFMFADAIWQWCSVNNVTGLAYPFGGVKVWPRSRVLSMRTHEACAEQDSALATDFWAMPGYYTFRRVFSTNVTNDSPYQAFRAGFREGAKLAGWNGLIRTPEDFIRIAGMPQSRRAIIWMSVGADVPNGLWSMLGARLGFLSYFQRDFQQVDIGAYAWFESYWCSLFASICTDPRQSTRSGQAKGHIANDLLRNAVTEAGRNVEALLGKPLAVDMTAEQSARFKLAMQRRRSDELPLFSPFGLSHGF